MRSKFLCVLATFSLCIIASLSAEGNTTLEFTPPIGWRLAESTILPPTVELMVVGKGRYDYPPSINLASEKFDGTLKDYLKIVKKLNASQEGTWKDLGKIRTKAGNGSLSQVDQETQWGPIRMMHVILVDSGKAYILTAASRKEEFPDFYHEFFTAMTSLKFENH